MKTNNRISGIDIIGKIPWGMHFCLFYQTKEDLIDILIPFFKSGLENNEFCIWVISEPLDVEEIKYALKKVILDIDIYLENGQFAIILYNSWYLNEGNLNPQLILNHLIENANQALNRGHDGLRFSGDYFWVETHWQDLNRYDEMLDSITSNYQVIVLCTCFLNKCDATQVAEIVSNHQFSLIKEDEWWNKIENSGRKRAEDAETKLQHLVKERTEELEDAYKSLKEREYYKLE